MNNKQIGTEFEQEFCEALAQKGYWAHFIVPDARGAQPFDIIAVKDGIAYAIDCKTCVANIFSMNRLEDNQIMAFEKWLACGNSMPIVAVKHKGYVYGIEYEVLKKQGKVKFEDGQYVFRYDVDSDA